MYTILLSRMALITRQSQEHWLAFVQIQQAIQEDDLWTAALHVEVPQDTTYPINPQNQIVAR
ncbi:hypothetical protein PSTT_15422 [Puccinia striiformis]|uniref:Uncharacterized protein n=1 Tax=Puccinia striiformis TaxID=27350 RepID=A0A2S4UHX2_9BASI|nr:hypothetical protein PSTT_15422 [Puccinia striiformis]